MPKALHILLSNYEVDSRVTNETQSLAANGYEIDVFCLKSNETAKTEYRNSVQIKRYGFSSQRIVKILSAYMQFITASGKKDYGIVHAHDFSALPIGLIISRLKRIPLIYDSHELWSQAEHDTYPNILMNTAFRIEKYCAHKSNYILTVSDSINRFLRNYFHNPNIATIRNIPSYTYSGNSNIIRQENAIPSDLPLFIYQGLISETKGIKVILDSLATLRGLPFKFIFMGTGPYLNYVQDYIRNYNLEATATILPAVPQPQLLKYLKGADVGVHAISNTCLNHDYCLPNKIFEYIHAGLAVLCTNLMEMSRLVHSNAIGLTFNDNSPEQLSARIRHIIDNKEQMARYKANSRSLSTTLTWDREFTKLQNIYQALLKN